MNNEKKFDVTQFSQQEIKELFEKNQYVKDYLNRQKDRHFSTSLETWRKNNLDNIVNQKIKQIYPQETQEQKNFRQLNTRVEQLERQKTQAFNRAKAVELFNTNKLPNQLMDFIDYNDENKMISQIQILAKTYSEKLKQNVIQQVSKVTRRTPTTTTDKVDNPLGYNPYDKDKQNISAQFWVEDNHPQVAKVLQRTAKK